MQYFIKIAYSGRDFHGYQAQKGLRTVQGVLTACAAELFGCPCQITGCSRTDAGVHARCFCAVLKPLSESAPRIPPDRLPMALCNLLPPDLSVWFSCEAPDGFHPRYDALGKEYLYRIYNRRIRNPFENYFSYHRVIPVTDEGFRRMCEAADRIRGRQDYRAFMAAGSTVTDCVRNVWYVRAEREDSVVTIRVAADGFLYNMVRIIVGTLLDCADGKLEPEAVSDVIASGNRVLAGQTAPPEGLCLERVFYRDMPGCELPAELANILC